MPRNANGTVPAASASARTAHRAAGSAAALAETAVTSRSAVAALAKTAAESSRASGSHRDRVERAAAILEELGGATSVEEHDGTFRIRGHGCPLGAAVRGHPEVCASVEALLSEAVGSPVRECCDHGERPQCCFEVAAQ